eukprot:jgi/Astpho2/7317/Aster-01619
MSLVLGKPLVLRKALLQRLCASGISQALRRLDGTPLPSWEPPQGTLHFAAAIKYAREVDGFLVAPTPLFGYPELGNRILLRECYPLLCSRLQQVHAEESWTSFVISGQEGVGKTYWLMWLLTRLVKEGRPVLWHDSCGYFLYKKNTVFMLKRRHAWLALHEPLVVEGGVQTQGQADSQSALPVYLIDSQEPMPHHARRWALLAQYPDMPKYKKFLKSNSCDCLLHFMPPFELEELMQLQPWGFPRRKRLTQDMVLERFLRLGGVPRDVFKNKIIGGPGLGGTLATMDLPRVTTADCAAYTPSAASSELTLITVPAWRTGDFTNVQVEFRSLHVAKEMWDWVQSPYRQDQCVQLIACVATAAGRQRPKKRRPSGEEVAAGANAVESIRLPCYKMVEFDDVEQLQVDPKALQYFKPYSRQYPAVDSFTSDGRLYIATHGEKHSVTVRQEVTLLPEEVIRNPKSISPPNVGLTKPEPDDDWMELE